jgi:hypothetical protein
MPEIGQSGSEGGAKIPLSLPLFLLDRSAVIGKRSNSRDREAVADHSPSLGLGINTRGNAP